MLSVLPDRVTARPMLGFLYYLAEVSAHAQMQMGKNLHIYMFFCIFVLKFGIVGEMRIVPFSLNKHTNKTNTKIYEIQNFAYWPHGADVRVCTGFRV